MKKEINNISKIVCDGLCMGCGVCQDICNKGCIKIKHDVDLNYPVVDNDKCTNCGLCLKVCAGKGINIGEKSKQLFEKDGVRQDTILGYYHKCFTGYSKNSSIRFHSSSGGILSTFLIYLLRHRIIEGAAVTGWSQDDCMRPQPFIARKPKDVICSRGSKYCVVSMEGIAKSIVESSGKYVVVGLPCHIQAYRKYAEVNKKFRESVIGYFAIYCSSNRTMRSQKYLLDRYGVDKKNVKFFAYRDEGCLGNMNFRSADMVPLKRVAYENFWQGMRGFFNVPRCSTCIDHYGELADVCFGDIYMGEYKSDHVGVNSFMSRSEEWTRLLQDAARNKWLKLDRLDSKDLISCQGYAIRQKKGNGVVAAFRVRKILGKKVPEYDVPFIGKAGVKDCLKELAKMSMRWMGQHEWTWPIIKKLHKDNKHTRVKGELEFETSSDGSNYIANKEFHAFNNKDANLMLSWKNRDWEQAKTTIFDAFQNYLEFIVAYCEKELNGREYSIDDMAQVVFGNYNKRVWNIEHFKKSLYAVKLYSQFLLSSIKRGNALQYNNIILTVRSDFEDLICCYEVYCKKSMPSLIAKCGGSTGMTHREIEWAGETLLNIELHDSIAHLATREIRPYNIVAARQLIENMGRKFIGYKELVDSSGNTIKQFSQLSWTFLSEKYTEVKNYISLPLSAQTINILNSWCNNFTHKAIIEPIYLQHYTWVILNNMNKPAIGGKLPDGREYTCLTHGDLRIKNWSKLKVEFEKYVEDKKPGTLVRWMNKNDVQAYIEG